MEAPAGSEVLVLRLPPLAEEDPLHRDKKKMLDSRNLAYNFKLPIPSSADEVVKLRDQMIRTARVLNMDELEVYFAAEDDFGPFTARNELESLNLMLKVINSSLSTANDDAKEVLQVLENAIVAMLKSVGLRDGDQMIIEKHKHDAEDSLLGWGKHHGVQTKLKISFFEGSGRGLVALEDIGVGDIALEIPESLIISEELLHQSDMFLALKNLDGITTETMLLLWSMRERYNASSKFRIYFETLPENFSTGLSFGIDGLAVLGGTLLFDELMQAKQHLRQQYDELFPMLCLKFAEMFEQEICTWDRFLWACELWYSNSMQVVLSNGKLTTCLVPVAGLLNHSVSPHIINYGRVDPATKSLKFPLSRPCDAGAQCFLSYGKHPGSHLITFYGFLPRGDNPYDVIPLDFEPIDDDSRGSAETMGMRKTSHMVRGTWLSRSRKPRTYGLPQCLLSHLRAALDCNDTACTSEIDVKNSDRMVLETLLSIFSPMLDGLGEADDCDRENATWDVKLALDYKDLQRRIVSSIVASCASGLEMLELS